jgi:DNA repair protein RadC
MSSIHTGHRQRMKEEFLARGLEGMPDHRVLELLLFYAIPQGDVNPLAHELLDRFGTLSDVFHAPYEELLKVKGVGANTATLIQLIPALGARYLADRVSLDGQLTRVEDYMEVLGPYFFGARVELCYLMCMDGKNKLITCRKLGEGVVDQVSVTRRKVVETALACNAARVVLAHNHVSGVAQPSSADVEYTRQLCRLLQEVNVTLVDHLVIVDGDMVSMAQSGYLR